MSGASGKVPAAIHVSPECILDGPLAKVQTGDPMRLDTHTGVLTADVDQATWDARVVEVPDLSANEFNTGRDLFQTARQSVSTAETGAISLLG